MRTLQKNLVGVVITTANGKIDALNARFSAMVGSRATLGIDLCALRPAEDRERLLAIKSQLASDNFSGALSHCIWRGETRLIAKNGAVVQVAEAIHALRGADGGIARFVHFLQDTRCTG